jgi:hypothetical protein
VEQRGQVIAVEHGPTGSNREEPEGSADAAAEEPMVRRLSPLEGTGFEPSVPRDGRQVFDNKPEIPDLVCQIVNRTKSSTVLQAIM